MMAPCELSSHMPWPNRQLSLVNITHAFCRFRNGRQEDAHEYLLCLLDHLHEAHRHMQKGTASMTGTSGSGMSGGSKAQDQANSFVHSIFGGRSRSQIECMGVEYESSLFEPFLDLSLQIFR